MAQLQINIARYCACDREHADLHGPRPWLVPTPWLLKTTNLCDASSCDICAMLFRSSLDQTAEARLGRSPLHATGL